MIESDGNERSCIEDMPLIGMLLQITEFNVIVLH